MKLCDTLKSKHWDYVFNIKMTSPRVLNEYIILNRTIDVILFHFISNVNVVSTVLISMRTPVLTQYSAHAQQPMLFADDQFRRCRNRSY